MVLVAEKERVPWSPRERHSTGWVWEGPGGGNFIFSDFLSVILVK